MKPLKTFHVTPALPENLAILRDMAYNLYWSWHPEVIEVFRRLDRDLWESTGHNPVKMLGEVRQNVLTSAAADEGFLAQLRRASEAFQTYLSEVGYVEKGCEEHHLRVGYFSMEFGLTECLSIYSGGLGMLAGDHLKSASDLGVNLVAVGLLYQQGYSRQYLNADGWQQDFFPENDFFNLPVEECLDAAGEPVMVSVDYPTGPVHAKVWRVNVGRVPLHVLDTNIPANARAEDRDLTDRLYGGDDDMRLRQEILLGIGGLRALDKLGLRPTVCHMNEGHAAFLALERIRQQMVEKGIPFAEAREATVPGNVFTTHTPVPAGNDRFSPEAMTLYFTEYARQLGLPWREFMGLGRENPADDHEFFCMTVLALKLAAHNNGVSELHGEVARGMWINVWPGVPLNEVPVGAITNGVHARSWVSSDMAELFDRYMGPRWADNPMDRAVWERVDKIPDEELWRTHERRRERLVAFARDCLTRQLDRTGATPRERRVAGEVLDPKALTIGFARRFATYKRGTLLLRDLDRLARIVNQTDRPLQIIYAGKAHPKDNDGKEFIRQIVHTARMEPFRHRIVFLEDYDQVVARRLVQGVDLWLNTPLRPLEASGTSGMKVVFNGGLNCSIPDGWWPEGYNGYNGWCIGRGESYEDRAYQDDVESRALYDLLEREIVPIYYDREGDGPPREWVARVKNSIRTLAPVFNTNRMVLEYTRSFYMPSGIAFNALNQDGRAKALADYKAKARAAWAGVHLVEVNGGDQSALVVGQKKPVTATVALGQLTADEVCVQAWYGRIDPRDEIVDGVAVNLTVQSCEGGRAVFAGDIPCAKSGRQGYQVRIIPKHPDLASPLTMGLVKWATA
ncbi:MAG: alpha-glucan family phosphorylase [Armatimonadetes bacterium]|nr:alpha-glucan family phosphorylase [Armatimonadota bacterium]